ncbi:hypothetical protein Pmar_PMAR005266 [Perkinsus marinus ATCC 50983]|uniref:Uncharacterized protein n=1 Tax=Perkinsus marinus (strain ATCC 50983 / TXsc) TaxID=423536 RepID=C5KB30_PERM5|nr:hypothetical protein Pmar_PMAR005266 [Perkinsus marinus ATCC 50983]EER18356.1 hypothetical protein Pmar_PMAR005266 [Perkinsus marinus ATCC 50983]|eukprot:XP_002786560.1 hypothetical protein Pmar_PMAR005266 [Perkinsus marinus ATCC 50983]
MLAVEPLILRFKKRGRTPSLELAEEGSFPSGVVVNEPDDVAGEPTRKRTRVFRKVKEEPVSLTSAQRSNIIDVDLEDSGSIRRSTKRRISNVSTSSQDPQEEDDVACYYVEESANYPGPELADAVDLSEWWAAIIADWGDPKKLGVGRCTVKLSPELLLGGRTMNLSASDGAVSQQRDALDLSPLHKAPTVGYVPMSKVDGFQGIAAAFRAYNSHVTYQTEEDDWAEIERKYLS